MTDRVLEEGTAKYPNILVFLPSIKDIKAVKNLHQDDHQNHFKNIDKQIKHRIEELHGGLTPQEKDEVISPKDTNETQSFVRIILATKIAETAITLDNIRYVIDSGLERQYYFDEVARLDYFETEIISESSKFQRKGRAGRVAEGYFFKMYSAETEKEMRKIAPPEIERSNLSNLILYTFKLKKYIKFSDLLFSERIQKQKIQKLTNSMVQQGIIMVDEKHNNQMSVTNKGNFIIQSTLNFSNAAFLYESVRLDITSLGVLSTCSLKMGAGFFRDKDKYNQYVLENIIGSVNGKADAELLGDISPLIHLFIDYQKISNSKKAILEKRYGIDNREISNLFKTRDNLLL